MWLGDKAQHAGKAQHARGERPTSARRAVGWLRRIVGHAESPPQSSPSDLASTIEDLPHLLDGSPLPNGVVEVVIEDARLSMRRVFDVHDGEIVPVEPGTAVPWTSIRGSRGAWTAALGCDGDVSQLHHTGEPDLAEEVLSALERRRLCPGAGRPRYSVLDCS